MKMKFRLLAALALAAFPGVAMAQIAPIASSRIVNFSARALSGPGDQTLIMGFIVSGDNKNLLVRGIGPALTSFGVSNALADPVLTLFNNDVAFAANDDWQIGNDGVLIAATAARVGAFPLASGSKDSALLAVLNNGAHTTGLLRPNSTTGVALIEIYDTDTTAEAHLHNVSARMQVGTGENILIAGFVIAGDIPKAVLIRGIGPTLAAFGIAGVLADPKIAVYSGSTLIATNDNWENGTSTAAQLIAAFVFEGAFALPAGSKDAALLVTLPPGAYTVQVSGVANTTGIALCEIYNINWVVDKGLDQLLAQINAAAPDRSKAYDGSVGDAAHAAGVSDHNPEHPAPTGNPDNQVDARDFTHDPVNGADMAVVSEAIRLSKDKRVLYIIFSGRIFYGADGPSPWTWQAYAGDNPHNSHMHVSVNDENHDQTQDWEIGYVFDPSGVQPRAEADYVDHMGADYPQDAGTPVALPIGGKVTFVGPVSGYGTMAVLVEVTLPAVKTFQSEMDGFTVSTNKLVIVLGHLRPSKELVNNPDPLFRFNTGKGELTYMVLDDVRAGQVIGYIETHLFEGDSTDSHVHVGMSDGVNPPSNPFQGHASVDDPVRKKFVKPELAWSLLK